MSTQTRTNQTVCEYCGERVDHDAVPTTPILATTLFWCLACGRWTE